MLRVPVSKLALGEITLDAEASRYVARVHRLVAGDELLLFDPERAEEGVGTVLAVDRAGVRCRVTAVHAAQIRAKVPLTLIQAIGKGDKFDAIVRDATELGATRIVATETSRSVVKLGDRAEQRLKRWRRIAAEAARQCGRGDVPQIVGPFSWEEALTSSAAPGALLFCLWERATAPIGPPLRTRGAAQALVFAIGPEGGLDDAEIEIGNRLGYAPVSLGPFILRTETVAAAVLGAALATEA